MKTDSTSILANSFCFEGSDRLLVFGLYCEKERKDRFKYQALVFAWYCEKDREERFKYHCWGPWQRRTIVRVAVQVIFIEGMLLP